MVKIAFVFPGQGSQFVGMGKDFYDHYSEARNLFEEANEILQYDISRICFNGPEETLRLTEHTQPALCINKAGWVFSVKRRVSSGPSKQILEISYCNISLASSNRFLASG